MIDKNYKQHKREQIYKQNKQRNWVFSSSAFSQQNCLFVLESAPVCNSVKKKTLIFTHFMRLRLAPCWNLWQLSTQKTGEP